jgi:hypothetical protein
MYQTILGQNDVTNRVQICAWCDTDKSVTKEYIAYGYKASHGICKLHCDEIIKETIECYEKQGSVIDVDFTANNDGGVQHNRGSVI